MKVSKAQGVSSLNLNTSLTEYRSGNIMKRILGSWKERYGRWTEEARHTDKSGGPDGLCATYPGHASCRQQRVIVDKGLDAKGNVVRVDSRGRGVKSKEATIDDKFARVIIGVQPSICYKGCFDHDTPRWTLSEGSRAADGQR